MLKKQLITLLAISALTACGGGGGGSSEGGSGAGALPSSKNTGRGASVLHLSNKENTNYLGVIHGLRTSTSTFEAIDTTTNKITPTDPDGYLSVAIQCHTGINSYSTEVRIFDFKIEGSREFDMSCKPSAGTSLSRQRLDSNLNDGYFLHTANLTGGNIFFTQPYPQSISDSQYNDELRDIYVKFNDYDDRTAWGLYYSVDETSAVLSVKTTSIWSGIRKQETNYQDYMNPHVSYQLPYDVNGTNYSLTLLDTPASDFYSLDYYSPSRFISAMRTSRKTGSNNSVAALIPNSLKKSGDYYIEHFRSPKGYMYRHITTNPQGANLFGNNASYQGNTQSTTVNYSISNGVVTFSGEPTGIESSLNLKGKEFTISYTTTTAGQQMDFRYYSELEDDIVLVDSYTQAFGDVNDLPSNMKNAFSRYDSVDITATTHANIWSRGIRFFYSNDVAGNGNITMRTN